MVTADQGLRGGKVIELKKIVDEAVSKCSSVKQVFVMARTGAEVPMGTLDIPLEKVRRFMCHQHSVSLSFLSF